MYQSRSIVRMEGGGHVVRKDHDSVTLLMGSFEAPFSLSFHHDIISIQESCLLQRQFTQLNRMKRGDFVKQSIVIVGIAQSIMVMTNGNLL